MAVLHKYVLGTFTNKVGGVVGSSWKGIPVVRSMPASVANPRSLAQMTQRMRFALMINFSVAILTGWIRPLWNRDAKRMSGFNAFVRANMQAFNLDGNIVMSELNMSRGRLLAPAHMSYNVVSGNLELTITHPTSDRYKTANDEIYCILYDNLAQRIVFAGGTGVVRGNATQSVVTFENQTLPGKVFWAAYRHPRRIFTSGAYFLKTTSANGIITPTSEFLFEFARIMKIDTSNIDSSLSEAEAIAVLKEAIKEKASYKEIDIVSEGVVNIKPTNDKHEYEPTGLDIDVEKDVLQYDNEFGELDRQNPQSKRSTNRGNR